MARNVQAEAIAQLLTHFMRSVSSQQSPAAVPESVIEASHGALDADEVACETGAPSAMSVLRSTSINFRTERCTVAVYASDGGLRYRSRCRST